MLSGQSSQLHYSVTEYNRILTVIFKQCSIIGPITELRSSSSTIETSRVWVCAGIQGAAGSHSVFPGSCGENTEQSFETNWQSHNDCSSEEVTCWIKWSSSLGCRRFNGNTGSSAGSLCFLQSFTTQINLLCWSQTTFTVVTNNIFPFTFTLPPLLGCCLKVHLQLTMCCDMMI